MHRMYICTCLTAKMALFTGLKHINDTNTLEQARAPEKVKESSNPHKFSNPRKF